jgi:hypothetical protein
MAVISLASCGTLGVKDWPTSDAYEFSVQYERSLSEAVDESQQDWVDARIRDDNFLDQKLEFRTIQGVLVKLALYTYRTNLVRSMQLKGYRPATLRELLAFATQYPEVQLMRFVVAFGSSATLPVKSVALRPGDSPKRSAFYPLLARELGKRLLGLVGEEQIPTLGENYSALFILESD